MSFKGHSLLIIRQPRHSPKKGAGTPKQTQVNQPKQHKSKAKGKPNASKSHFQNMTKTSISRGRLISHVERREHMYSPTGNLTDLRKRSKDKKLKKQSIPKWSRIYCEMVALYFAVYGPAQLVKSTKKLWIWKPENQF